MKTLQAIGALHTRRLRRMRPSSCALQQRRTSGCICGVSQCARCTRAEMRLLRNN
jgi:hypothetical protein